MALFISYTRPFPPCPPRELPVTFTHHAETRIPPVMLDAGRCPASSSSESSSRLCSISPPLPPSYSSKSSSSLSVSSSLPPSLSETSLYSFAKRLAASTSACLYSPRASSWVFPRTLELVASLARALAPFRGPLASSVSSSLDSSESVTPAP